jgi:hypothetical protein
VTDLKSKAAVLTQVSLMLAAVFWGLNYVRTSTPLTSFPRY